MNTVKFLFICNLTLHLLISLSISIIVILLIETLRKGFVSNFIDINLTIQILSGFAVVTIILFILKDKFNK